MNQNSCYGGYQIPDNQKRIPSVDARQKTVTAGPDAEKHERSCEQFDGEQAAQASVCDLHRISDKRVGLLYPEIKEEQRRADVEELENYENE